MHKLVNIWAEKQKHVLTNRHIIRLAVDIPTQRGKQNKNELNK